MNYIIREHNVDRETVFSFDKPNWGEGRMYLNVFVARISDGVGMHRTEIRIINNVIQWHEYHLRDDSPCITKLARLKIEKIWKLKAFL